MTDAEMALGMFAAMSLAGMFIAMTIAMHLQWQLERLRSKTNPPPHAEDVADLVQVDKADSQSEKLQA